MRSLALLALAAGFLGAVETPVAKPSPTGKAPVKSSGATTALPAIPEEERWVFEPRPERVDIFYDRESVLVAELAVKLVGKAGDAGTPIKGQLPVEQEDIIIFAEAKQAEVEAFVAARKFEDAIKAADAAVKKLERHANQSAIQRIIAVILQARSQAEEAKIRNEAQAAFDALNLMVQGILWSEGGGRLAILAGEGRALGINDRVKGCVIITIDTDRVDFRFHFRNHRFEFSRYVGEESNPGGSGTRGSVPTKR